jgi:hypothetical protein
MEFLLVAECKTVGGGWMQRERWYKGEMRWFKRDVATKTKARTQREVWSRLKMLNIRREVAEGKGTSCVKVYVVVYVLPSIQF